MKTVHCSVCDKEMQVDDRVGDTCVVSHGACLEEALRPTRELLAKRTAELTLRSRPSQGGATPPTPIGETK